MQDPWGVYGECVDYALTFFFTGSAFILFAYLWRNKKLDFDEDAKEQMMDES